MQALKSKTTTEFYSGYVWGGTLIQQNIIISNLRGPALTSEVRNKPYTFICIDCSQAIYHCSIKPEVQNTDVRYTEVLHYSW